MENNNFILKGDVCWSTGTQSLGSGAYLVCAGGKSAGVFETLPREYAGFRLIDYTGSLIIPGLVDLHIHAPQFAFRSLGMDLELLDWLESRAFPEEAQYADIEYACHAYRLFVENLKQGPNTRAIIFATVHTPATILLMDMLEEAGLVCLVGKVNMDRNCPASLCESNAGAALAATREWLDAYYARQKNRDASGRAAYHNVHPILTPRFIPSCSDALMAGLADIQKEFKLPVQSHVSENRQEVQWVQELCPQAGGYGAAYAAFDLFGGAVPTTMAHCVWSDEKEISLLAQRKVFIAHCPQSNTNLSSGIAPVRKFLDAGCNIGLGSDVAGGAHTSIFRAMSDAIQVSKLRSTLLHETEKALSLEEAFYLGTAGGGAFFAELNNQADENAAKACLPGACGSFAPGYDFDALVIDDTENPSLASHKPLSIHERLERVVYLSDERHIKAKYVRGKQVTGNH